MAKRKKSGALLSETRTINVDGKEMDLIRFHDRLEVVDGKEVQIMGNWKIHNWDRAAVRDRSGSRLKREYFLFGIEYHEEEFKDRVRDREGMPWYKNPAMKGVERF
jgi:hypothetical protein